MNNNNYSPLGFRFLPPVVRNLIILNVIFFVATLLFGYGLNIDLKRYLGLHFFKAQDFGPWQFVTYMFMHDGFTHIFFNMFALWMFGTVLEQFWGPKRFLTYYFITGIGAALVHYGVFYYEILPHLNVIDGYLNHPDYNNFIKILDSRQLHINSEMANSLQGILNEFNSVVNTNPAQATQLSVNFMTEYRQLFLNQAVVVGASGAIYGLLLAFGMLFPNSLVYLYFFIPIKAKWFVIIFGALELYSGIYESGSNVAHFAHLGGMIFGIFLILYWRKKGNSNRRHYSQY